MVVAAVAKASKGAAASIVEGRQRVSLMGWINEDNGLATASELAEQFVLSTFDQ